MSGLRLRRRPLIEAVEIKHGCPPAAANACGLAGDLIRLARPGIMVAVLLAGYAGMVLSARSFPSVRVTVVCLTVLLLSAAGSAMLNGLLELSRDREMVRLRGRVAALGRFGESRLLFTALACIATALMLALTGLNLLTAILTLAAVLFYTLLYTLGLKRWSPWGAVPGGVPGALPVLIGQAAAGGAIDAGGLLLFATLFLWQPPHFWLLALSWQDDYRAAGIPVLPAVRGEGYTSLLIFLYTIPLLPVTLALAAAGPCSLRFALWAGLSWGLLLYAFYHYTARSRRFDLAFRASLIYLGTLLAAVIIDVTTFPA
jgi:protoheme IX farnesyltransferase